MPITGMPGQLVIRNIRTQSEMTVDGRTLIGPKGSGFYASRTDEAGDTHYMRGGSFVILSDGRPLRVATAKVEKIFLNEQSAVARPSTDGKLRLNAVG